MDTKKQEQKLKVQENLNGRVSIVKSLRSRMGRIKPEKFGWDDVAQQIIGASIFAAPFAVTEEVWMLANQLSFFRVIFIMVTGVIVSSLIFYYTKFQKVAMETEEFGPIHIPTRLLSLLVISYGASIMILWMFGVLGGVLTDFTWGFKLVVLVSFFSSIGAATADILK